MAVSTIDPNGLNVGQFGNRNMVLNGSMAVAQRATSVTGVSSAGYHTCDRYRAAFTRAEYVCTVSQDTSAPSGFANSYKIATTTSESALSAGDQINISQRFEGQNLQSIAKGTSDAKQLTLSFWVKSSIATTWTSNLYDADNTRHCSKTYTTDVANTWEYKTITFPADTTGAFGNDNGGSLYLRWFLDAGTDWTSGTQATAWAGQDNANTVYAATGFMTTANSTWQITGVQIEVGDTATPFEHRSYGDELQKCQRYFFKLEGVHNARCGIGGYVVGSTEARFDFILPVSMRAVPTLSGSGTASFDASTDSADFTITNMVINSPPAGTITGLGLQIATSGMVAGQAGGLRLRSAGSSLTLDSEL